MVPLSQDDVQETCFPVYVKAGLFFRKGCSDPVDDQAVTNAQAKLYLTLNPSTKKTSMKTTITSTV